MTTTAYSSGWHCTVSISASITDATPSRGGSRCVRQCRQTGLATEPPCGCGGAVLPGRDRWDIPPRNLPALVGTATWSVESGGVQSPITSVAESDVATPPTVTARIARGAAPGVAYHPRRSRSSSPRATARAIEWCVMPNARSSFRATMWPRGLFMRMMVAAAQTRRGHVRRICGAMRVRGCGGGGEGALLFRKSRGSGVRKARFRRVLPELERRRRVARRPREVLIRVSCLRDVVPSCRGVRRRAALEFRKNWCVEGEKRGLGALFLNTGGGGIGRVQDNRRTAPSATYRGRRATYRSPRTTYRGPALPTEARAHRLPKPAHHLRCNIHSASRQLPVTPMSAPLPTLPSTRGHRRGERVCIISRRSPFVNVNNDEV